MDYLRRKKLYNISFKLYSSGKVQGKVSGKGRGIAKNFLVLLNGNFGGDLSVFSMEETYILAELLVNFLTANPELLQVVNKIMGDENNAGEITWN
jgi:hypothetical protein